MWGRDWTDLETRERAHVHGWRERRWRHLDACEYQTVIIAKAPRLKLPSGETMTVVGPWSEEGGGPVTSGWRGTHRRPARVQDDERAARLARVSIGEAEGVMERAVRHGLLRREEREMPAVGLDEEAIRKPHHYATGLSDIGAGASARSSREDERGGEREAAGAAGESEG